LNDTTIEFKLFIIKDILLSIFYDLFVFNRYYIYLFINNVNGEQHYQTNSLSVTYADEKNH